MKEKEEDNEEDLALYDGRKCCFHTYLLGMNILQMGK
jgi:hypothetical protein